MGETYGPERRRPEIESPIMTTGQIRDVIEAVETLESRMQEAKHNASHAARQPQPPVPHQYRVHEEPEPAPARDEFPRAPPGYFLPPGAPHTLQSVMRPDRPDRTRAPPPPPYRRPSGPELPPRRPPHGPSPPPSYPPKPSFPLSMPITHGMPKKPYGKPGYGRLPPMQRPMSPIPPMKAMPPLPPMPYPKPTFVPPKQQQHNKQYQKQKQPPLPPMQPVSNAVQNIIVGKPGPVKATSPTQSQTLSLGRTDIIANQVVKSQITLPGGPGADVVSSSGQQLVTGSSGQIILGKPMDHPVPLDQQMTPTQHYSVNAPPTYPTDPIPGKPNMQDNEVKSSDFIGESTDPSPMQPAVNTGFKPNTIVIESGFKPIIREPLMDRTGGDYSAPSGPSTANRREDTDVDVDYDDSPQPINNHAFNTPSDKITQSFEPMFIPSPPDTLLPTNDRTKEVFPSNHAKEDRPHPVYVKSDNELNSLFSKKNMDKEVPSDMVMESDRVSPHYLPPDPKVPKEPSQKLSSANEETFTTYDGKIVSAATLTSVPDEKHTTKLFSSKLPATSELLLKGPQFGPFRGEIPPAVAGSISKTTTEMEKGTNTRTNLKLVNTFVPQDDTELDAEGSEHHDVKLFQKGDLTKFEPDETTSDETKEDTTTDIELMGAVKGELLREIKETIAEVKDETKHTKPHKKDKEEKKDEFTESSTKEGSQLKTKAALSSKPKHAYYEPDKLMQFSMQDDYITDYNDGEDMLKSKKRRDLTTATEQSAEQNVIRNKRGANNQIDFQINSKSVASRLCWSHLLLLPLFIRFF
ncbi:cell surface glycoprotein 1 isoform X1 [Pectinophora gossypiella]|uniref:cell surface glycoprotein 1 isoform X1 n=1 Tax=Pectinophora gossypiella TaxID=13191 RepID=UPI00214E1FD3|nr:cell surface glycoprotein 1 isoform X1 [Pectinophora gossypiella]